MTMPYEVRLPVFEGPLDLLLYLIKKNELDIYNIPIAEITEQYLKYMEIMRTLNLDVAGEYLVLAATLLHIKSRMLLPNHEEEEDEEEDPRNELVQQLVTYQAVREAARALESRPLLEREVFTRGAKDDDVSAEAPMDWEEIGLFALIDAFQRMLKRIEAHSTMMAIEGETVSLAQKMAELREILKKFGSLSFEELFSDQKTRRDMIYTFLALLELMRRKVASAYQLAPLAPIRIFYEGEGINVDE